DSIVASAGVSAERIWDDVRNTCALISGQPVPAAEHGDHVAGIAMHRPEELRVTTIEILFPNWTVWRLLQVGKETGGLGFEESPPTRFAGHFAHRHACQHRARHPPHQLANRQLRVCASSRMNELSHWR